MYLRLLIIKSIPIIQENAASAHANITVINGKKENNRMSKNGNVEKKTKIKTRSSRHNTYNSVKQTLN